ncbi:hypothetical protein, partial [Bradyrhizobium sp.]|uniref:hypothetical protein n=1 Tax=Bradyrhizobium sp. TaxID=376 RepID=UPI0025BA7F25
GIEQNPSCVPERMSWQNSSVEFVILALKLTNWRTWSGHERGSARGCHKCEFLSTATFISVAFRRTKYAS